MQMFHECPLLWSIYTPGKIIQNYELVIFFPFYRCQTWISCLMVGILRRGFITILHLARENYVSRNLIIYTPRRLLCDQTEVYDMRQERQTKFQSEQLKRMKTGKT